MWPPTGSTRAFVILWERHSSLSWLEAAQDVVFEDCPVIRSFPARPGRRVAPGWWWSSTTGRLVAYVSGVMRTRLMLLDRDPAVVALACRPVELVWREDGKVVGHAPQLMATGAGAGCGGCCKGSGLVLPACGAAGSGVGGQCAVAGGLPASPLRRRAVDAGSGGGLQQSAAGGHAARGSGCPAGDHAGERVGVVRLGVREPGGVGAAGAAGSRTAGEFTGTSRPNPHGGRFRRGGARPTDTTRAM
jgi:hypothetical protein